ncbi:hypothetical protein [Paenibacillus abyssi]|uniref:Uncharacterized protein n=1 Tax=Paenibacillus abyssi TaxID=1340531 RepID=A0A917CJH2_9BACL|nr:hypothetical protein [Paenibacillus abyssi]GGF87698.1 hypothetical protein GCM10010916_01270 [Paenibacillus abyssi]
MKWSTFIAGGLVGMTAVAFLANKRPGALTWMSSAAGDVWSGMKNRGLGKIVTTNMADLSNKAVPKSEGGSEEASGKAWLQIGQLLEKDPKVKQEADKILADNTAAEPHH